MFGERFSGEIRRFRARGQNEPKKCCWYELLLQRMQLRETGQEFKPKTGCRRGGLGEKRCFHLSSSRRNSIFLFRIHYIPARNPNPFFFREKAWVVRSSDRCCLSSLISRACSSNPSVSPAVLIIRKFLDKSLLLLPNPGCCVSSWSVIAGGL